MTVFPDHNKRKWVAQVGGFPERPKKRTRFAETQHDAQLAERELIVLRDELKAAAKAEKQSEELAVLTTDADEFSLIHWVNYTLNGRWRNSDPSVASRIKAVYSRTDPMTDIRKINLRWCDEYVRMSREEYGLTDQTILCQLSALFTVLEEAQRNDAIAELPNRPNNLEGSPKKHFTPERAWCQAMIVDMGKHNYANPRVAKIMPLFCRFLMLTGCRTSEGLQIKWADVSFTESTLVFKHKPKEGQKIKNKKDHVLPLWSELEALLLELKKVSPVVPFPFTYHCWHKHFTKAKKVVVADLKLPKSVLSEWVGHDFRRLSCTEKADLGWDAWAIQEFHNHSSVQISERYVTASKRRTNRLRDLMESQSAQPLQPVAVQPQPSQQA